MLRAMSALVAVVGAIGAVGGAAQGESAPHARFGIKPIVPPPAVLSPDEPRPAMRLALQTSSVPGAVARRPAVYLVFWGNQWARDPAGAAPALQAFFEGLAGVADGWGKILRQYCQGATPGTTSCVGLGGHVRHPSSPLGGVWFDTREPAPKRATYDDLSAEAIQAANHFGNTTQARNANAQYVIASATGTHPDGFPGSGFCAYHSSVASAFGNLAWTNLPYVPDLGAGVCTTLSDPSLLDGYFSTESHEYAESVTDLWPALGWTDRNGSEIADLCQDLDARESLSTGTFDVQGIWSNAHGRCVTGG